MSLSPLITGIGLATPLGNTLESTWAALVDGSSIIGHARVPGIDDAGEARIDVLARRVAREAVRHARWTQADLGDAALIVGTSKGPADAWLESFPSAPATRDVFTFGLAQTATAVAHELGIGGPRLTLSAACSSGLHALIRGAMMIRHGEVQRAMIVAAESSLHPLFIASFRRLGVIPLTGHGCRPFDQTRAGFVIGEGAAAICLEAGDCVSESPSRVAIEDFALAADAAHLTANDPAGITLSRLIRAVLGHSAPSLVGSAPRTDIVLPRQVVRGADPTIGARRSFAGQDVDLIHAHGTGTIANDADELRAIESSLDQPTKPILYSHKGAMGHTLGAAGLVAIAINVQCHREGIVPPNPNTRAPLPTTKVILSATAHRRTIRHSLTLAAGFGGALAAVRLKTHSRSHD